MGDRLAAPRRGRAARTGRPRGSRWGSRAASLLAAVGLCAGAALATSGPAGASSPPSRALASRASSPRPAPPEHGLVGASRCAADRAAGPITFVSPFGYAASAGIIDVFAAQHLGYFGDLCLTVKIVASSYTPSELVSAGTATITGEGSAADDLALVADGAHLVSIATFGDTSDYALLTQPGITRLTQLEGKVVAYHTTMPVILTEMLQKAGVDVAKLDEVDDTSYDPDLLTDGKFAALQAYRSNEPLELREQHLRFREYIPSQFGVAGTFNLQVANKRFLAEHPRAVAAFLRAELHGFDYCTAHPVACVSIEDDAASAAGVQSNPVHNLAEWRFEDALAEHNTLAGKGVGVQSEAEWAPEAAALVRARIVTHRPDLAAAEDTSLAASLYDGRRLIWPGP